MVKDNKRTLTLALIERTHCTGATYSFLWDAKQDGFGVKLEPSGHKSYIFQYRFEGKSKRKAFGSITKITLEQARELANDYAYTLSKGTDPFARDESKTLYEIASDYIEERKIGKGREKQVAPKTYGVWKHQLDKYVKNSEIGTKKISKITIRDATKFMDSLAEKPIQANRIRSLMMLIFTYSIKKGYRDGMNVWEYVDKYPEDPQRPRLIEGDDEKKDQPTLFLNYMLAAEKGEKKDKRGIKIDLSWVYMILTLYFTGARPDDICNIKISDIDFENSIISRQRSKTGAKKIMISRPVEGILRRAISSIKRLPDNPYLFAGKNGEGYRKSHGGKQWANLREETGITAPPYALRRYFALIARRDQEERGGSMKIASQLMGHADEKMTAMYAGEDPQLLDKERKVLAFESEKIGKRLQGKIKPA